MDTSIALARAYLERNGYFVLTELPVQVADRQRRSSNLRVRIARWQLHNRASLKLALGLTTALVSLAALAVV